jgi:hypothetical protein
MDNFAATPTQSDVESKELQKLYDAVDNAFPALKAILDKYPKCFSLDYHGSQGHFIDYDLNALVHLLRVQD